MDDSLHVELVETPSTLAGQLCQAFTVNGTLVELPFADVGYMTCKPTFFAAPSDGALYALAWAVSVVFTSEGDWGSYEEQVFLLRFPCGGALPNFAAGQLVARQDAATMSHFAYTGNIVDCRGLELDGRIWLAWLAKDSSWQVWRLKQRTDNDNDDDDEPFEVLASGCSEQGGQSVGLSVDAEQATVTIQNNAVELWSLC